MLICVKKNHDGSWRILTSESTPYLGPKQAGQVMIRKIKVKKLAKKRGKKKN